MKSGPVFLWRGSVALLCEACQRLMIRWNIQTPATRRQAHWYEVIPNHGLSYADPQTFIHAHVLTTQTCTVHTHIRMCTHTYTPTPPTLQRCWCMTQTWHRRYTQQSDWKKNEWQRFRDGNLAIDSCYVQEGGEKSKLHERDLPLALMSRL